MRSYENQYTPIGVIQLEVAIWWLCVRVVVIVLLHSFACVFFVHFNFFVIVDVVNVCERVCVCVCFCFGHVLRSTFMFPIANVIESYMLIRSDHLAHVHICKRGFIAILGIMFKLVNLCVKWARAWALACERMCVRASDVLKCRKLRVIFSFKINSKLLLQFHRNVRSI